MVLPTAVLDSGAGRHLPPAVREGPADRGGRRRRRQQQQRCPCAAAAGPDRAADLPCVLGAAGCPHQWRGHYGATVSSWLCPPLVRILSLRSIDMRCLILR